MTLLDLKFEYFIVNVSFLPDGYVLVKLALSVITGLNWTLESRHEIK